MSRNSQENGDIPRSKPDVLGFCCRDFKLLRHPIQNTNELLSLSNSFDFELIRKKMTEPNIHSLLQLIATIYNNPPLLIRLLCLLHPRGRFALEHLLILALSGYHPNIVGVVTVLRGGPHARRDRSHPRAQAVHTASDV